MPRTGSWSPVFATSEKLAIQTKKFEGYQVAPLHARSANAQLGERCCCGHSKPGLHQRGHPDAYNVPHIFAFNAREIPSVAYTDPEVAWVGLTEDQAKAQGIKIKKGFFPWAASGRATANGRTEGFTKLLFDDSPEAHGHGKILGGGIVGPNAGDLIGEVALAIEMVAVKIFVRAHYQ